jgi:imidazolonepropionase-like amidohydrolase
MRAALIILVLAVTATAAQPPTPRPIAITGVTVIDPNAGASVPDMTVVIREGRIASAGAGVAVPRDATVIDGRGQFLMPGLWDMHVHVSYTRESAFPAFVANGVTAVRDLGGDLAEIDRWRTEIAAGSRVGPMIVRVGPMLIGQNPLPFQTLIETPEEGRDTVRRLHAAGVDQIKVKPMARDAYFAIVAEARALELPVTGHVQELVSPAEVSDAGQSIEHVATLFDGTFRTAARRGKDSNHEIALWRGTDEARELFQRFVRNGTFVDPTLVPYERLVNRLIARLPDPDWKYTAASARAEAEKNRLSVRYDAGPQPRIDSPDLRELQAVTRMMHEAGVKLLAGTDVSFINAPGFSLHDELDLLVAAGLPPAAALRAATSNPAAMFPKLETGSVAPGRRADLVLLDANPLTDIRNARRIRAVVLAGKLLDRAALDRLLAEALELAKNK